MSNMIGGAFFAAVITHTPAATPTPAPAAAPAAPAPAGKKSKKSKKSKKGKESKKSHRKDKSKKKGKKAHAPAPGPAPSPAGGPIAAGGCPPRPSCWSPCKPMKDTSDHPMMLFVGGFIASDMGFQQAEQTPGAACQPQQNSLFQPAGLF